MPVFDAWDRDQFGNWEPGACVRQFYSPPPPTPVNGYITEDGSKFYVAEDGSTFYVRES